jgi:hypothetical protein
MAVIAKLVPGWLIRLTAGPGRLVVLFFLRRATSQDMPLHLGMGLLAQGTNADLYRERLKNALDLLSAHAPIYLRWLRTHFRVLFVDQLFMIMRRTTYPYYGARLIMVHPYTAWRASPEQLALYLAADATRGRLGRRFRRGGAAAIRAQRRAVKEMISCAHMLPSGEPLVVRWEQYLAEYDRRYPEAAASSA